jgi:hypothetical protein
MTPQLCVPIALFHFDPFRFASQKYREAIPSLCAKVAEYGQDGTLPWDIDYIRRGLRMRQTTAERFWEWMQQYGLARIDSNGVTLTGILAPHHEATSNSHREEESEAARRYPSDTPEARRKRQNQHRENGQSHEPVTSQLLVTNPDVTSNVTSPPRACASDQIDSDLDSDLIESIESESNPSEGVQGEPEKEPASVASPVLQIALPSAIPPRVPPECEPLVAPLRKDKEGWSEFQLMIALNRLRAEQQKKMAHGEAPIDSPTRYLRKILRSNLADSSDLKSQQESLALLLTINGGKATASNGHSPPLVERVYSPSVPESSHVIQTLGQPHQVKPPIEAIRASLPPLPLKKGAKEA